MKRCYLIGYPVGHSVSPPMHNAAFKELGLSYVYDRLDVEPRNLEKTIRGPLRETDVAGLSVTIPHKIEVMKHLDALHPSALKAGAVNTIACQEEKQTGYNTDATGGVRALSEAYGDISDTKTVLLGAGGAAHALAAELSSQVRELVILNRTSEKAKVLAEKLSAKHGSLDELNTLNDADILINTTSVGMAPNISATSVPEKYLHSGLMVFDIVYNPLKTRLMLEAEKKGAKTLGGLWMLVYQGAEAFKIWTGVEPPVDTMYRAAREALKAGH